MFTTLNLLVAWTWFKTKWKYFLVIGLIIGAFIGGRYSTSDTVKLVTHTVSVKNNESVSKKVDQEDKYILKYVDRPVDRVITKTIVKEVGGKITETTIDATHEGNTVIAEVKDSKKQIEIQIKKEIVYQDRLVEKTTEKPAKKLDVGVSVGYSMLSDCNTNIIPSLPNRMFIEGYGTYTVGSLFSLPIKTGIKVSSRGDVGIILGTSF